MSEKQVYEIDIGQTPKATLQKWINKVYVEIVEERKRELKRKRIIE